jgi:hypothetical protein
MAMVRGPRPDHGVMTVMRDTGMIQEQASLAALKLCGEEIAQLRDASACPRMEHLWHALALFCISSLPPPRVGASFSDVSSSRAILKQILKSSSESCQYFCSSGGQRDSSAIPERRKQPQ